MKTFIISFLSGYKSDLRSPHRWFGAGVVVLDADSGKVVEQCASDFDVSLLGDFICRHGHDQFVVHDAVNMFHFMNYCDVPLPAKLYCTKTAYQWLFNQRITPGEKRHGDLHDLVAKLDLKPGQPGLGAPTQFITEHEADRLSNKELVDLCLFTARSIGSLYGALKAQGASYPEFYNTYLKAVAAIEDEGICLDVPTRDLFIANKSKIIEAIVAASNTTFPLFTETGKLIAAKVKEYFTLAGKFDEEWPVTGRHEISLDINLLKSRRDTLMLGAREFFSQVLSDKQAVDALNSSTMTIDYGRNYHEVCPFTTITGRNAPRSFIFQGQKWQRFLMIPEDQEHTLLYVDFKAQELGIAAALSGDPGLKALYNASDPYLAFAEIAGVKLEGRAAVHVARIRKVFKETALATLYGKTAWGMANSLGIEIGKATWLLDTHKRLFPYFWSWRKALLKGFAAAGVMETDLGWRCKTEGSTPRTRSNFKIQGTGADILRLATIYLHQQEIRVLALVHDGILMTCKKSEIGKTKAMVDDALTLATEQALPGFALRWDYEVCNDRYFPGKPGEEAHQRWLKMLELVGLVGSGQEAA